MLHAESILKSTPPRLPPAALERARLTAAWQGLRERGAIVVTAPAGYGKTTLLLQWRRRWLERDAYVAWLSIDAGDEPPRLAAALLHSLRVATGRIAFGQLAAALAAKPERGIEAMTALLAEVALLGVDTVLMLDEVERMPSASMHKLLAYLLHNAPPNLHLVLASRLPLPVATAELAAKDNLGQVGAAQLRLTQEESCQVLAQRFGARIDLDRCVRLHDTTEGWPLGMQLVAATLERSDDVAAAAAAICGRHGDLGDYFLDALFSRLPPPLADFLVRVSILEWLGVETCEVLTGCGRSAEYLDQLVRETPILSVPEQGPWLHLHPLARDFLLARFEGLAAAEREALHGRAYEWFAKAGRFHEAATHALAAGNMPAMQAHAARALWSLGTEGRVAEAREWLRYIPERMLAADVELRLYAAWALVFGDRNAEALAIAEAVLDDPGSTPRTRVMATRVAGGAAICADRLDILEPLAKDRPEVDAHDPLYRLAFENGMCVLALHAGATAEVRDRASRAPGEGSSDSLPLSLAYSRLLVALSFWQEGDAFRVEAMLRPLLRAEEADTGRRGMLPCVHAPLLATALRELGQSSAARGMLADRLDVIERTGEPDAILLAYCTLANLALDSGDERRALLVLENLEEFSRRRGLPRLAVHALAEGVRLHAQRGRLDTARELLARLGLLGAVFAQAEWRPHASCFELCLAMAKIQVALAAGDESELAAQLELAESFCSAPGRARERLALRSLRAVQSDLRGDGGATAHLREAAQLAELGGLRRLLLDAHPAAARLLDAFPAAGEVEPAATPAIAASAGALLTPREARILELLGSGISNKAIARALEISHETVKWHLKNIYAKLSAGSRRHAVGRARLLGLLAD